MSLLKILVRARNLNCLFRISKCDYVSQGEGENLKEILFCPYQNEKSKRKRKVSIIGAAGHTGIATTFCLFMRNYIDEIILVDTLPKEKKLCGEALDILHGAAFSNNPKLTISTNLHTTKDSDVVILQCGIPRLSSQSRYDIAQNNVLVYKSVVPQIAKLSPEAVLLCITNPVDIMTYAAWKYSRFDKNRVIGIGTNTDTARFRYHLSRRLGIHPNSIDAWIIGEHGHTSVALWSTISVAGTRLREIDNKIATKSDVNSWMDLHDQVHKDGETLLKLKGNISWSNALTVDAICRSILNDTGNVHAISTLITGMYNIEDDIFLGFPAIIGNRGVKELVHIQMEDTEMSDFKKSVSFLGNQLKNVMF